MGYSVATLKLNAYDREKCDLNIDELLVNGEQLSAERKSVSIGYSDAVVSSSIILAHKNFDQTIAKIKEQFDIVLIDSPGAVISSDASNLLKYADFGLYIVRSKVSKVQFISNVDLMQEETGFDNMYIALNGVHHTTNFSGTYNGSKLNYGKRPKGIWNIVKHYYRMYIK